MNSRRQFLKQSCLLCLGATQLGVLMTSCGTSQIIAQAVIENNKLIVAKDKFANTNTLLIRNRQLPYDILLVHNNEQYTALQMRCTHNDVALSFTGKKLVCNAHGSEFNLEGKVTKEPAEKTLTHYKISENKNNIFIHL